MMALRNMFPAWHPCHNKAPWAYVLSMPASLRHKLDQLPENHLRQFCRIQPLAPPVSSVRTHTVEAAYHVPAFPASSPAAILQPVAP